MAPISRRALLVASGLTAAGASLAGREPGPAAARPLDPLGGGPAANPRRDDPPQYVLRLPQVTAVKIPDALARKGNRTAWPVLQGISIAQVEIAPGALRAPHFHTNTPELVLVVQGSAKAGLIGPSGQREVSDLAVGDCIYFPTAWPHWLRNTGAGPLLVYFNYAHEQPETFEVADVDAFAPPPA